MQNYNIKPHVKVMLPKQWMVVELKYRETKNPLLRPVSTLWLSCMTAVFCANRRRNNLNTLYSSCSSSSTSNMCFIGGHSYTDGHFVRAYWVTLARSHFWREPRPIIIKTLLNSPNLSDQHWCPFHLSSLLLDCAFSWQLLKTKLHGLQSANELYQATAACRRS
jgi:hypothetical protein